MKYVKNSKGFTIVELLIVIVVIGILAALVLNSFSGVQAKARDSERDTDVKALTTQLEAWYNGDGQGSYPSTYTVTTNGAAADVNLKSANDADASAKLKGIDINSMRAPGQTSNSILFSLAPSSVTATAGTTASTSTTTNVASKDRYIYQPLTSAGAICDSESLVCTKFNILYVKEGASSTVVTKTSLNQ